MSIRPPLRLYTPAKSDKEHGKIIPIVGDVNSKEDIQRAVDYITKDSGHIDLLVYV